MSQQLEYRAAPITGISYPKRTIEMIVMPYEKEAIVDYRGGLIREVISRGAFDGLQTRTNKVKLNRDHDESRSCGFATAFHPSRQDGLVAEVYVSKTGLGNETLELANDGILGASAGFAPLMRPDGTLEEEWPAKNFRRVNKVYLGHIAMTPTPAYEDAKVLAVRADPHRALADFSPVPSGIVRPNLDQVRALRRRDEYAQLSR